MPLNIYELINAHAMHYDILNTSVVDHIFTIGGEASLYNWEFHW